MNTKTVEQYDCMNIKLIKRLLDENLVKTVLTDSTYEDSFRLADSLNIEGDTVQYEVMLDFIVLNYDDSLHTKASDITKSKWISMVNSIDDLEEQIQNVIDYYRTIVSCYDEYDYYYHSDERKILSDLYNDGISVPDRYNVSDCYEEAIAWRTRTYKLLHWITDDMYTIESIDIPRAEIIDNGAKIDAWPINRSGIHRILIESLLYDRLSIPGRITNRRMAAIEYAYGDQSRSKYMLYALMRYPDVWIDHLSSIYVNCPSIPHGIIDSSTVVNQEYTYTVYSDRSDDSPHYAYKRQITVPFSSIKHAYLIRHEPHSDDHIKAALELCILTDKPAAKIVNTYEGTMYTITSKLTTEHIIHYGRLLRANDVVVYTDPDDGITNIPRRYAIAVNCIRDGYNIYEYAALVYDCEQHLIVDCIVVTNSRARVNKYCPVVTADPRYSHRFVIEDVGEDAVMTQRLVEFISRYPSFAIIHHNVLDPSILCSDDDTKKVSIEEIFCHYDDYTAGTTLKDLYDKQTEDEYLDPLLFNRAFNDCIAAMKVGLIEVIPFEYKYPHYANNQAYDSDNLSDAPTDYGQYNGDSMYM